MDFTAKEKDGFYPTPYILAKMFNDKYHEYFGHVEGLVVWDASCGVGALTNGFEFNHPVYSSTLHVEDLEHVENPNKFQFDFLHGDVNTLPQELQDALKEGRVLYYQNPPYNKVATEYGQSLTGQGLGTNTSMLRQLFQLRALELGINKLMNIVPEATFLSRAAQQVVEKMPTLNYCTSFPGSIFPEVNIPAICIFIHGAETGPATEYIVRDTELKPVMIRGFQDYTTPAYKDILRKDIPRNTHRLPRFTSAYKLSTSTSGPQGSGLPSNFPYTSEGISGVPKKEGYGYFPPTREDFGEAYTNVPEDYAYYLGVNQNFINSRNTLSVEPFAALSGHPETLVPEDYAYTLGTAGKDFYAENSLIVEPLGGKYSHPEALVPEDYAYTCLVNGLIFEKNNSLSTEPACSKISHPETLVPEDYLYWQYGGKNGIDTPVSVLTEPCGGVAGSQGYPETFTGVRDKLTYFTLREVGRSILPKTLHRTEPMAPDFTNPKYLELRELGFLYAMFAKQNYMVGGTIVENKLSLFNEWGLKKDEPVYIEGMKLMNKYKNEVPVDAGFWNVWNWFMSPKEKADFNIVRNELAARIYKLAYEMDIYVKHDKLV